MKNAFQRPHTFISSKDRMLKLLHISRPKDIIINITRVAAYVFRLQPTSYLGSMDITGMRKPRADFLYGVLRIGK